MAEGGEVATRRWLIAIVAVLTVWMGGYALLTRAPDASAYRQTCVQAAQSAVDGLATARLSTDGDLLSPYRSAMDDDAQKLIEQARGQLGATVPPDSASQRRRDTLIPLLDRSEALYADLTRAQSSDDPRAERDVLARMAELERQLTDFIDGNR